MHEKTELLPVTGVDYPPPALLCGGIAVGALSVDPAAAVGKVNHDLIVVGDDGILRQLYRTHRLQKPQVDQHRFYLGTLVVKTGNRSVFCDPMNIHTGGKSASGGRLGMLFAATAYTDTQNTD